MRWMRTGFVGWVGVMLGCASAPMTSFDDRPLPNPAPIDVQEEIRDARFFLPLPDEPIGPPTGFVPRDARHTPASL